MRLPLGLWCRTAVLIVDEDGWAHIAGCTGPRNRHWQAWELKVAWVGVEKIATEGKNRIFKRMPEKSKRLLAMT